MRKSGLVWEGSRGPRVEQRRLIQRIGREYASRWSNLRRAERPRFLPGSDPSTARRDRETAAQARSRAAGCSRSSSPGRRRHPARSASSSPLLLRAGEQWPREGVAKPARPPPSSALIAAVRARERAPGRPPGQPRSDPAATNPGLAPGRRAGRPVLEARRAGLRGSASTAGASARSSRPGHCVHDGTLGIEGPVPSAIRPRPAGPGARRVARRSRRRRRRTPRVPGRESRRATEARKSTVRGGSSRRSQVPAPSAGGAVVKSSASPQPTASSNAGPDGTSSASTSSASSAAAYRAVVGLVVAVPADGDPLTVEREPGQRSVT